MDKILNIKDLEQYRFDGPGLRSGVPQLCYMVPKSVFGGDISAASSKLNSYIGEERKQNPNMHCIAYIIDLDEMVQDDIERLFYNHDLWEDPKYKDNPDLRVLADAVRAVRGWKPERTMMSFISIYREELEKVTESVRKRFVEYLIQVNSWTDVVTNSSSEIFVCGSNQTPEALEELLRAYNAGKSGGKQYWTELQVQRLDWAERIRMMLVDDNMGVLDTLVLEDHGLTPEVVARLEGMFREMHGMESSSTLYTIMVGAGEADLINFMTSKLGARYLEHD